MISRLHQPLAKLYKHNFINAVFWMYLASGILSFGTLIYHIILGRYLTKPQFGEVESAISLFYIFLVPLLTIASVVIKVSSTYYANDETEKLKSFIKTLNTLLLKLGVVSIVVLLILTPFLTDYLKFSSWWTIILITVSFFIGIFVNMQKGILQGVKNFKSLMIANTSEAFVKSASAGILIFAGFAVGGAIAALIASSIVSYLVASYFLRQYRGGKIVKLNYKKHLIYIAPFFVANLALTSMFTSDIVLVRALFSTNISGDYSALALMGKIIYYGMFPVSTVMFSFISSKHARNESHTKIFILSILLTLSGSFFVVFLYYIFPTFFLNLFGSKYTEVSGLMWTFGLFITFYTLNNLLVFYYLSISKYIMAYVSLVAAFLQVIFIYLFSGNNINNVIYINIFISIMLFCIFILYYIKLNSRYYRSYIDEKKKP